MMPLQIRYLACLGASLITLIAPAVINVPLHAAPKSTASSSKPKIYSRSELTKLLFSAVQMRDLKMVRSLLARGADVNGRTAFEETPLMLAMPARNRKTAPSLVIARELIQKGANINAKSSLGIQALDYAIGNSSPEFVKLLVSNGANLNPQQRSPEAPLTRAIEKGDLAIVKILLAAGAKFGPGTPCPFPQVAAGSGGNIAILRLFLARGIDINQPKHDGSTALMKAARSGHIEAVKFLLSRGSKVNARTKSGYTALHGAASAGEIKIVRLLIEAGANANTRDRDGGTPLIDALVSGQDNPKAELTKILLDSGANPNGNLTQRSPLYWAAESGNLEAVRLLLGHGAKIRTDESALFAVTKNGNTAVSRISAKMDPRFFGRHRSAAEIKQMEQEAMAQDTAIVQELLNHGVDVTKDPNRVALVAASEVGIAPIVRLLIAAGAPVNLRDAERKPAQSPAYPEEYAGLLAPRGDTPLTMAAQNGHIDIINLLLEAGADPNFTDRSGETPLMHLAGVLRALSVQYGPQSLPSGPGIFTLDDSGKIVTPTPPIITEAERTARIQRELAGDIEIVKALLARKANLEVRNQEGQTALMLAAANSHPAIVQLLLDSGANVNSQDHEGLNALMTVILRGRISRVPYLGPLSEDPAFQAAMSRATSSAMKAEAQQAAAKLRRDIAAARAAVDMQDIAVIKSLLAAGASKDSRDKQGRTALQIARDSHRAGIITLLEK